MPQLPYSVREFKWIFLRVSLCLSLLVNPAHAITGNEQISLAGFGKFDVLAEGIEKLVSQQPLMVADWHALCYAYSRLKRYGKIFACLDSLEAALKGRNKQTRLFGLDDATPTVYQMRADALIELSQYGEALVEVERVVDWYQREKSDDKDIFINALAAKVLCNSLMGQHSVADRLAAELEALPLGLMGGDYIGAKSLAMAKVNMALGRWQKVLDALAEDRTFGLRVFLDNLASGAFLRGVNNWVWIELPRGYMQARALLELGRAQEAKVNLERLLAIPEVSANGEISWMVLFDLGRIAESGNQLEQAESLYLRAADVIERQRASINTEANKIGFVGDKQAIYTRLVGVQFKLGKSVGAFESMERAKSRALVDMLASRQTFAVPLASTANKSEVQGALDRLNEFDEESRSQTESNIVKTVAQGQRSAAGPGTGASVKSLAKALPADLASLVSVSSLGTADVQKLLERDESLLVYFGDMSQMYATVVTVDSVTNVRIESGNLERDLRKLRKDLQDEEDSVDAQLKALHQTLIVPVMPLLKGARLTIVPHTLLHYLPFSALTDGKTALVDQFSLRQLPSASVLSYLRASHADESGVTLERMLILGNPDLKNAELDLPGSQAESEKIATQFNISNIFLRDKASKATFSSKAPQSPYIHVASHGKFNAARPLQSALLLASDQGVSGQLTVSDLYVTQLNSEMVTLSACETGLGAVSNGDDVVGLTRGFLYAGASTVIASLWQVDDEATASLMLSMYAQLKNGDRRNALRKAQIETRAKYPHPYYWAAFYLTGVN